MFGQIGEEEIRVSVREFAGRKRSAKARKLLRPPPPSQRVYSFLEFFAGIGLTHAGLAPYGWRCVYANDIDARKREMYQKKFPQDGYFYLDDIWSVASVVAHIKQTADLATASFPCIDLSLAGNRNGLSGEHSGAFFGFIQVLQKLRENHKLPRAVLVENVVGFLTSRNGEDFRSAAQSLADLGYHLDAFVLDAKYFIPQSRPRVFMIGCQSSLLPKTVVKQTDTISWKEELFRRPELRPSRLREIIEGLKLRTGWIAFRLPKPPASRKLSTRVIDTGENQEWWSDARVQKHLDEMHDYHRTKIEELRRRRALTFGTIYRRVRNGQTRSEMRIDGLAGCLRTPRGGSSKQIVFVAGNNKIRMRWMSPIEYARLQGAPDFPLDGIDPLQALFGFGDAVCVPVISWIAKNVLRQIFPA